ncbi:hypothetical protein CAOG_03018 [Capsaspora owczarzaki ATCC 30864]|uniref:Ribonuclease P protein subunit p20 n=1 Tax=Capsaspora owczarzaki (strain ATCC 30864) TaxID=595528 RepID=A0A0D2WMD8_CAPO3|nr:hypothetical protein CAOG_03018 [Capsaspora owczarzaki ATCC 30864]KJE91975.1 hypothetical protein CAOG_003018 [Capsaspora owczarzaki ATCC 30864]|eukprot:XP_004363857.1 hypothetical protein CAOG_03018 [Capsaspora owczarzaki ATCC 30864]
MEVDNSEYDDAQLYNAVKRAPQRLPTRPNDIYVTRSTHFDAQFARAQKLLDSGYSEICLHGLGASINRAINLALQLQQQYMAPLVLSTTTSTVELTDDLQPKAKNVASKSQTRSNSAVHIKVEKLRS